MHRLFVALRPPRAMRAILHDICHGIERARWQEDAQFHVTLRYIGQVERPVAEDIAVALHRVRGPAPVLALSGVGAFEERGHGRAVWAGVTPQATVAALHRKIDQALVAVGLPPERRAYHPHVTLARLNAASGPTGDFLAANAALASSPERFDRFFLYESHLGRDGAWYEPVERYPVDG